jgi:hypothetical protein
MTVDVPDPVFRKMKATAALRGVSLKEFRLSAVEHEMAKKPSARDYTVRAQLIPSKPIPKSKICLPDVNVWIAFAWAATSTTTLPRLGLLRWTAVRRRSAGSVKWAFCGSSQMPA